MLMLAPVAFGGWVLIRSRRQSEPAAPAPNLARVVCEKDRTRLLTPRVLLRPDGVHFGVENPGRSDILFVRDVADVEATWAIDLAEQTALTHILSLPPGDLLVGCFRGSLSALQVPKSRYTSLTVLDPGNHWPEVRCWEEPPPAAYGAGSRLAGELEGQILFSGHDEPSSGDVYKMDADGSNVTRVRSASTWDKEPAWSPDGSRIAFSTLPPTGNWSIHTMDNDGSDVVRVTKDPGFDFSPAWSPDGTQIAFVRGNGSLHVVNTDGSGDRQLDSSSYAFYSGPEWSPDGTKIVFVKSDREKSHRICADGELHMVSPDGSDLVRLTDDDAYDFAPAWSPDGSRIAFMRSNRSDYAWDIYVMNSDGSDLRRLTDFPGYDGNPAWSPDGTLIAFSSDRATNPQDPNPSSEGQAENFAPGFPNETDLVGLVSGVSIFVMNADGSALTPLANASLDSAFVQDWR